MPTKIHLVKALVFPVVMYGCESWTIKKAEHQRINAFEQCCWRTLESPLDSKKIKPVNPKGNLVLNIHWKDWCWSWSSNTSNTWCKELTHWKRPWYGERLRAKEVGDRGWDGYIASLTQQTWIWASPGRCWRTEGPVELLLIGWFSDWTTRNSFSLAETHLWCLEVQKLFGKWEKQCLMQKWRWSRRYRNLSPWYFTAATLVLCSPS